MSRIAIVDLVFNWPPSGGSMVDIREVAIRLQKMGHEIRMFVPHFETFFPRGRILQDPGFPIERIEFNKYTLSATHAPKIFRQHVDAFKPDVVFLADGYSLKPWISDALSHYPQVWRAYSYEMFCPLNNLIDTRIDFSCTRNIFRDQGWCEKCCRHHLKYRKSWLNFYSPVHRRPEGLFLFHEYWLSLANTPEFLEKLESAIKRASKILVYNRKQRSFFEPFNPKVTLTPTGVSDLFHPRPPANDQPKKISILMSGRMDDPVKGFIGLRYAAKELYRTNPDFELVLTAKPHVYIPPDPFTRNAGWLTSEQLAALTAQADIVCVPSYWEEAFGIVAVEAMACGKPVIACRVGGLQEIVQHGRTGFLVEPRSSYDLTDKLRFLLDHPEIRRKMGEAGLDRYQLHYRWDKIFELIYIPLFGNPSKVNMEHLV